MDLKTAISLFKTLENDKSVQKYYAKVNARYILFGVKENRDNFPDYQLNLDDGADSLAFSYLSIGCCMFEDGFDEVNQKGKKLSRVALEKGGEYIEYNHFYEQSRRSLSSYYLLIGALAYYSACQYSKAFIVIGQINKNPQTDVSILTSAFLRKDFRKVFEILSQILINQNEYINRVEEFETKDDRIQVVLYARAFAMLMDYIYSGDETSLEASIEILNDLSDLLMLEREPSFWWIVRLLKIIVRGFANNSIWKTIPPYFPENESKKFIENLVFAKNPVIELFVVQRKALEKVLTEQGCVVSLPTSSGKTRIAEIAIYKTLTTDRESKILFIAPFRSLAYEVEESLSSTFGKMGYVVSQLYGNGQFNQLDNRIIENSDILIATPEKAKVILRANNQVKDAIKLVVIDEGHLLNAQERQVRNEMFVEELKKYASENNGKIILLSAVLPNSQEIAEWIVNDEDAVISDDERVSRQRLGVLNYRNNNVHLKWFGDEESYNPNFISAFRPSTKHRYDRPSTKNEAVAYTAVKLSKENSLLIFIAGARSVLSLGDKIIEAMKHKEELVIHQWSKQDIWQKFQLLCKEYDNATNKRLLALAKYGILCHTGKVNAEIRSTIEILMREDKPRIIIATTTLGQGVNLGVSSIIFADTKFYIERSKEWFKIKNNDFWNIVGRAGRAFVDTEGKILYATENQEEEKEALRYFENEPNNATSGILDRILELQELAKKSKVDFSYLLDLITSNNLEELYSKNTIGKKTEEKIIDFFDLIDDTLLSFEMSLNEEESIDDYLRRTLAFIQARNSSNLYEEDVISFLKARSEALNKIITKDLNCRRLISSGLPLSSAITMDAFFDELLDISEEYKESAQLIEDKIFFLKKLEDVMLRMPSRAFKHIDENGQPKYTEEMLDDFRTIWLKGRDLQEVENQKKVDSISTKYYGYTVAWFLGAVANRFKKEEEESDFIDSYSELIEELALCCELGVPDLLTAKLYMVGIKSRKASKEIRDSFEFDIELNSESSIGDVRNHLLKDIERYKKLDFSDDTIKWLELFEKTNQRKIQSVEVNYIPKELYSSKIQNYYVRKKEDNYYLCNSNYTKCTEIHIEEEMKGVIDEISNTNNMFFAVEDGEWQFVNKLG